MIPMRFPVRLEDVIRGPQLWRFLPTINVDRGKDIPRDYPGPMGVPITFLDKVGRNDGHSGFLLVDQTKPLVNGKWKYARYIIRNLRPDLPPVIDLADWLAPPVTLMGNTIGTGFVPCHTCVWGKNGDRSCREAWQRDGCNEGRGP